MSPDVVVDIGNTRIKWGRVQEGRITQIASLAANDEAAWQRQLDDWARPQAWVLTGVQPQARQRLEDWFKRDGLSVLVLDSATQLPLIVAVEQPDKVGLDRLLDAVAVNARRPPGHAAIIIDAGTAITVDYVDASGVFQGGAIMPGLSLTAQALHEHTALLPRVTVAERRDPPGKATIPALQAGIFHGVLGGIESLVRALRRQSASPCDVYFGGGDARLLAPHLSMAAEVWETMTLEGILRAVEARP